MNWMSTTKILGSYWLILWWYFKCWCIHHWHHLKNSILWIPIKSFLFFCVSQQFAYRINSRTYFSSTYSTQRRELLITFFNGNSAQNSSVGKNQYSIQKFTNFWLITMMGLSVGTSIDIIWKIAFFGYQSSLFILLRFATVCTYHVVCFRQFACSAAPLFCVLNDANKATKQTHKPRDRYLLIAYRSTWRDTATPQHTYLPFPFLVTSWHLPPHTL